MAGRYDKVKVKYNGAEYTPKEIVVYRDRRTYSLGGHTDTSVNTTALVQTPSGTKDILKHPVLKSTPAVYKACNHVFMGIPENGFCFNPCNKFKYSHSSVKSAIAPFWFQGFIQKDTDEDIIVFESYRRDDPSRQYYRITWQADGYIRIDIGAKESKNPNCIGTTRSSRPFKKDTPCWLDTYCTANSYNNFGICFASMEEFDRVGGNLRNIPESWSYMNIRAGGNNGDDRDATGPTAFNLGWVNENATNCLGDYYGATHGGSRLRFLRSVWVGGSQIKTGQQQLYLKERGWGDEGHKTPCNILVNGTYQWVQYHYLDPVVSQESESHYEWE